jgi:hypothetical protein
LAGVGRGQTRVFDSDEAAAEKWIRETFRGWLAALTAPQHEAVNDYKGNGYRDVNARLRDKDPAVLREDLVVGLDEALAIFRLAEAVVVWRGMESATLTDAIAAGFDLTEAVIVDPAYVSTSLLEGVAREFLAWGAVPDEAVLARIVLRAETRVGAYVGAPDLVSGPFEFELLLPRETPMRITGVDVPPDDTDDVPTIHFEVDP